jgi:diguanylate cyclase
LVIGTLLGFWLGRRVAAAAHLVDRQQFLHLLQNLSSWTTEFAGDVSNYQTQLTSLSERVQDSPGAPREEILGLLSQIMNANQQLQQRLDSAEERLESQTHQIADYLTEARTDGLTSLMNRRSFDQDLNELYATWLNKHVPFAIGLVDIDHFKKINDTYGHLAGDAVLVKVAEVMQTEFRDAACVARYGGEEFGILFHKPLEEAAEALDRLREKVAGIEFQYESSVIPVTLSAGAAQVEGDDQVSTVIARSDEALYAAKLSGRNRVYLHDRNICRLVTKTAPTTTAARDLRTSGARNVAEEDSHRRIQERLARIVEEESRR